MLIVELNPFHGFYCLAISCDDPGTPINGYKSSSNYNAGSVISFGCNKGYKLSGSSTRTCGNGQWTGSKATCLSE